MSTLIAASLCLQSCSQEAEKPRVLTEIRYMVVEAEPVTLTRELPGRVSAFTVSEVRPQVGGIIVERLFEEGADVEEGQVLYQIDASLYEAAFKSAQAELSRAEAEEVSARLLAQRYRNIVKAKAVSQQEYDDSVAAHRQAKAAVDAAREAVETARINLGYTKVTSPVSGRIGKSFVTPGALATQHQASALATVQQLSPVYVDVAQSSMDMLKLRRAITEGSITAGGDSSIKVRLKLEDSSPYVLSTSPRTANGEPRWIEGELLFSDVTVQQSTGVVNIRASFKNEENILLPGMYVRAIVEEGVKQNALLVPQKAVMRDSRGQYIVYALSKKAPEKPDNAQGSAAGQPGEKEKPVLLGEEEYYVVIRSVQLERDFENNWLVASGLEPGDRIIIDGLQKVRSGEKVAGVQLPPDASALARAQKRQGVQAAESSPVSAPAVQAESRLLPAPTGGYPVVSGEAQLPVAEGSSDAVPQAEEAAEAPAGIPDAPENAPEVSMKPGAPIQPEALLVVPASASGVLYLNPAKPATGI